MCLVEITRAILENKNSVLPVSSWDKNHNICISTPAVVGEHGVNEKVFIPLTLEEEEKLTKSINVIKNAIKSIES